MKRALLILSFLAIFLGGCNEPFGSMEPNVYVDFTGRRGVFIGCEGNFMYGNASLSFYDKQTKEVYNQVFYGTNNFPMGDVLQSVKIQGDLLYMMVNNSGKIYVADKNSMVYKSKISGLTSPRYINFLGGDKAYVSDLYSPAIAVIDTRLNEVTGGVMIGFAEGGTPRSTEEMIRYKDFIYTCSWSYCDQVYKIDTRTDKVVDSLRVTKQPNSLVLDKNNKLWVMCDGAYVGSPYGKVNGALCRIDAETFTIEKTFVFSDETVQPSRLRLDASGENIYYVYGRHKSGGDDYGIYKMSVDSPTTPTQPFIKTGDKLIYSLGIDNSDGDIYVGDAIDYSQAGMIYRYNSEGELVDNFRAGIIPGSFAFKYE